jgi:ribosomal protein S18 acetylase RimI-like enzyme
MADYLFGADEPPAARRALERLFRAKSNRFSHQFAETITQSGKTAGLVMAYSALTMKALEAPTALSLARAVGAAGFARFLWRASPLFSIREAEDDEYFISNLAVAPECQGQGLGSAMLAQVEQRARAQGITRVSLTVDIENVRAFALYLRTGFKVTGTVKIEQLRKRFGYGGFCRMVKEVA